MSSGMRRQGGLGAAPAGDVGSEGGSREQPDGLLNNTMLHFLLNDVGGEQDPYCEVTVVSDEVSEEIGAFLGKLSGSFQDTLFHTSPVLEQAA